MGKENGLITDSHGSFESRSDILHKITHNSLFDHAIDIFKQSQDFRDRANRGVEEAIWMPQMEYSDRPVRILMGTDFHYGSVNTDYTLLKKHLDIVEHTPNTFLITNGDHIDNFNVTGKWATGTYENPLPPQQQMRAFIERMERLADKGKIGVMSFGNHDNFIDITGYDWLESFARTVNCPLFTSGGLLHTFVGGQRYDIAMTHKYWGTSKLNPSNACKRFMEHEHPDADIIFLGHTHQSEVLSFERGGKERIGIIGGTYKLRDNWAKQMGIGGRAGHPGITVMLYPNERKMIAFKRIEDSL